MRIGPTNAGETHAEAPPGAAAARELRAAIAAALSWDCNAAADAPEAASTHKKKGKDLGYKAYIQL